MIYPIALTAIIFLHIGTSRRFWVAETKALELSCRFRHSGRISDTYTDPIQWLEHSKKTHDILEIWFWNRHVWFKKTKKPSGHAELALNFPKNQKLLKSVHGARRTDLPNAIGLRGGVPPNPGHSALSNFRWQLTYLNWAEIIPNERFRTRQNFVENLCA